MSSTVHRERVPVGLGALTIGAGPAVVIGGPGADARWISLRDRRDGLSAAEAVAAARARWPGPVLVEPSCAADLPVIAEGADGAVAGAAWMRDLALVRAVARLGLPVILRRAPSATLREWLAAAEDCAAEGNDRVLLCESGDGTARGGLVLDLALMRAARELSGRPVLADLGAHLGAGAGLPAGHVAGLEAGSEAASGSGPEAGCGAGSGGGGGAPAATVHENGAGREDGPALAAAAVAAGADGLLLPPGSAERDALAVREAARIIGAVTRQEVPASIPAAREAIDRVDAALAVLLERRAELAMTIQRLKPVGGFAGRDADRERRLVAEMARRAPTLGETRLAPIMNAVIEAGLHLAEERRPPPPN
ncbi:chorismate mutase [Streptosporangium longisporum]|uniref:Chorismate mutase domain-containing protein n=1 Tax=Streptosporangium longisporum TaxID=46187 RepID=A0ABP6LAM1_9ACTN